MDMAQAGMSKKGSSLLGKKDVANEDLVAIRKEAEETNSMKDKMETLVSEELRDYMSQNRSTLSSKVKATLMRVSKKILQKAKPRKKRTTLYPIVASVLKFHKDDDVDAADAGSACRS